MTKNPGWARFSDVVEARKNALGLSYMRLASALNESGLDIDDSKLNRIIKHGAGTRPAHQRDEIVSALEHILKFDEGQLVSLYDEARLFTSDRATARRVRTVGRSIELAIKADSAVARERVTVEAIVDNPGTFKMWSTANSAAPGEPPSVIWEAVHGCALQESRSIGGKNLEATFSLPELGKGESTVITVQRSYPDGYPGEIFYILNSFRIDFLTIDLLLDDCFLPAKAWAIQQLRPEQRRDIDLWGPGLRVSATGHAPVRFTDLLGGFVYGIGWQSCALDLS